MIRVWNALLFVVVVSLASTALAQQPIRYIYDDIGRLVGVVDPAGDTVVYSYDAVGNLLSIARFASTAVSVIAFTPGSGPEGATVKIEGTGFSGTAAQNTVTFNGTAATVSAASATELTVTVPAGGTTGPIAVTSPSGSATSAAFFTVTATAAPTITSFSPAIGIAGDATTIAGTNYETTLANNKPAFNVTWPIYGRVTAATSTSLSVMVPPAATSGRISVATPGGKATSTQDFFVPPSPYTAASVAYTNRLVLDGASVTVGVPAANKIGMVVFDATAGERISLGISGSTMSIGVSIYKPDGVLLTSSNLEFAASAFDIAPVPVTGTYLVVVDPNGTGTGSTTLTLSQEVTGSLTVDGAALPISITRPGQRARITFAGTAGQRLDLGLTGSTISSATASVLKPDGTVLGTAQTFGAADNALDTVPALPATGTYAILINPNAAHTGNVTLTLSEELAAGPISVDGDAVSVTIARAGQQARLTFDGTAGQRLSLGLTSNTIPSGWVIFHNPGGSTLVSQFVGSGNTAVDTPVLPSTGTYEILIDPAGAATAAATLTLSTEVTGTLTIGGGGSSVSITRAGQRARLTFTGTAGNRVSAQLSGGTIPSGMATLFNPDGSTLATQGFGAGATFIEPRTTATSGTYTLLLDPGAAHTGSITVALYEVPADVTGTLTVNGGAQAVSLTGPGQKAVFTFTWNAGQQVTVGGANSTIGCLNLIVKRPDNATLSISPCTATFSLWTTSPVAGTFTVTIDPAGANTGSVDLSATNP